MKETNWTDCNGTRTLVVLAQGATGDATEPEVLSADGMREVIEDLGPKFACATGHQQANPLRSERVLGRPATTLICFALLGSIYFGLLGTSNQARSEQLKGRLTTFIEVVEFVQEQGWLVRLGGFCRQLELSRDSENCIFKQISLEETEGRSDPYGFYVPVLPNSAIPPYVLVIHVRPIVREYFVASSQGVLIKAYYQSKRTQYFLVPNADVEHEFKKDVAYWTENFARIKREVELERLKRSGSNPP